MKVDHADPGPLVGVLADMLGVRITTPDRRGDVSVDAEGCVHPRQGMSATVDDPNELPGHRKPAWLKGTGKGELFVIKRMHFPATLDVIHRSQDPDDRHHYQVEPASRMHLDVFLAELASTKKSWQMLADEGGLNAYLEEAA